MWPSCERRAGCGYEGLVVSPSAAVIQAQGVPRQTPEEAPNLGDPAEWSGLPMLPQLLATGCREARAPGAGWAFQLRQLWKRACLGPE